MGRGRGIGTVLSQVQKQGMVCAVFDFLHQKFVFSVFI